MQAQQLTNPGPATEPRLTSVSQSLPVLISDHSAPLLLLRVTACAVCHTDLHLVEGDLPLHKRPVIPGHQVVATVLALGQGVTGFEVGDRVGVPWLFSACGQCEFCRRGQENLCDLAQFTGWDVDGGYARYIVARSDFVVSIPAVFDDIAAAPLLCAGIIGYRSLRLAEVQPGERVGLVGFGASAHLAIQIARHWDCQVAVFTRSAAHRKLAEDLGASWTGSSEDAPPWPLDRAAIFAPVGALVPTALSRLRKGGTLAINAIHMTRIPEMNYNLLYGERTLRSVTNATRQDAAEFLKLAAQARVSVQTQTFPLAEANQALMKLKAGEILGAAVLLPSA